MSDHEDVRLEVAIQLPGVAQVVSEKAPSRLQEWIIPVFEQLVSTNSLEVIQAACLSAAKLIQCFTEEERAGIITLILRIVQLLFGSGARRPRPDTP